MFPSAKPGELGVEEYRAEHQQQDRARRQQRERTDARRGFALLCGVLTLFAIQRNAGRGNGGNGCTEHAHNVLTLLFAMEYVTLQDLKLRHELVSYSRTSPSRTVRGVD